MKRKFCFLLCLSLICACAFVPAFADMDLSQMPFDELVALKDQINIAIWNSKEWQEVTVPQGVYTVGKDIPAGHWTIRTATDGQQAEVYWCDMLDESGVKMSYRGKLRISETVYSTTNLFYREGKRTQVDYELSDGQFIIIDLGAVIFSPYAGKPSLGFN